MFNKYYYLVSSFIFGAIFYFDYTKDLDAWTWLWLSQAVIHHLIFNIMTLLDDVKEDIVKELNKR